MATMTRSDERQDVSKVDEKQFETIVGRLSECKSEDESDFFLSFWH